MPDQGNALLHGCAKARKPAEAQQWYSKMKSLSLSPDEITHLGQVKRCMFLMTAVMRADMTAGV